MIALDITTFETLLLFARAYLAEMLPEDGAQSGLGGSGCSERHVAAARFARDGRKTLFHEAGPHRCALESDRTAVFIRYCRASGVADAHGEDRHAAFARFTRRIEGRACQVLAV